jgi:two-component system response regulator (stage 0 sporulation protein F)
MKTLLLVDDDRDVLHCFSEILCQLGFNIITKHDAKSALYLLRAGESVDLVITDQCMPEIDGIEFIVQLKKITPKLPIIMLFGNASVEIYLKALNVGAFECMNKPIKAKHLMRIVDAALAIVEEQPPIWINEPMVLSHVTAMESRILRNALFSVTV